jgi:acetyltransferase-like isoleucine patch superfamily enzyme
VRPGDVPDLDEDLGRLWSSLVALHERLRDHSWSSYRRANPFTEELFDWKEKGAFVGGEDVTVYDSVHLIGDVAIGDHSWVGPGCMLDGSGGLTIGCYCSIASGAQLVSHDTVRWALSGGRLPYERSPVVIEDHCFIGTYAVVLRGVRVGTESVVAAGSVVKDDVPSRTIVAGAPARPVGRVEFVGDDVRLVYDV